MLIKKHPIFNDYIITTNGEIISKKYDKRIILKYGLDGGGYSQVHGDINDNILEMIKNE